MERVDGPREPRPDDDLRGDHLCGERAACRFHDRMAVILDPAGYNAWLDPGLRGPELLRPCAEEWLEVVPIVPKRRRKEPSTRQSGDGITNQGTLF